MSDMLINSRLLYSPIEHKLRQVRYNKKQNGMQIIFKTA